MGNDVAEALKCALLLLPSLLSSHWIYFRYSQFHAEKPKMKKVSEKRPQNLCRIFLRKILRALSCLPVYPTILPSPWHFKHDSSPKMNKWTS
jgi:hypothetical protein